MHVVCAIYPRRFIPSWCVCVFFFISKERTNASKDDASPDCICEISFPPLQENTRENKPQKMCILRALAKKQQKKTESNSNKRDLIPYSGKTIWRIHSFCLFFFARRFYDYCFVEFPLPCRWFQIKPFCHSLEMKSFFFGDIF